MSNDNSPTERIVLSPVGYTKILMHCLKYPHATVNGLLLVKSTKENSTGSSSQRSNGEGNRVTESDGPTSGAVEIVDVVPLFHLGHGLSPMMEVALLQVTRGSFFSYFSHISFTFSFT